MIIERTFYIAGGLLFWEAEEGKGKDTWKIYGRKGARERNTRLPLINDG